VAASAALLAVAFRGVDLAEVGRAFGDLRPAWLLAVVASLAVRFWLTALRWQVLLRPVKTVGVHRLFAVTLVGFMANNVLPARMGELVRAYALGRVEALAAPLAFATIVVERVFDGLTLVLFLAGGLLFLRPRPWLVWSALASTALYLGVLAVLCSLRGARGRALLGALVERLPGRWQAGSHRLLDSFRLGLDVLGSPAALLATAALSLAIWTASALGVEAMFRAMALGLPAHAAFLFQAIVAVALILPSAPGYVGAFQVGAVAALALYAVPEATALSLSIVFHAANYVPITLAGLAYLGALNLSLGDLRAASGRAT
jgi:uncharacterized protein (TIRG00374 family)